MYKNNSRNISKFNGCSRFGYYSYTTVSGHTKCETDNYKKNKKNMRPSSIIILCIH